ncbi:MAG: pesticidal protein Cry7Aa [Actinobacteria bacterium]|nr:pesticidal protein Cry7Aa [Actinomycetota bacterium]
MINIRDEGIILEETSLNFEARGVLNPACIKVDDTVHMFYRAISKNNISSIGYCQLRNNKIIKRLDKPVIFPEYEYEKKGIEDPRIVFLEGLYYMTYTAYDGKNAMIAYATSSDLINFKKGGIISPKITYKEADKIFKKTNIGKKYDYFEKIYEKSLGEEVLLWDKDACLFPKKINNKYALLHRILPSIQVSYFNDFSELDTVYWEEYLEKINDYVVIDPELSFENEYVGTGCPPIETAYGWLLIYHCVERINNNLQYHSSVALLDINNPLSVLNRLKKPLFSPVENWEKAGNVNNVVFPTGAIIEKDRLYIYYGAADKLIASKSIELDELIQEVYSL